MPGWPLALNTGVNGVNRPERVNVDIGSGAAVSSVPSGSGALGQAGVSTASYGARKGNQAPRERLQAYRGAHACTAFSFWIIEKIAQLIGSMSSAVGSRPATCPE